jgi:hypothetical protein
MQICNIDGTIQVLIGENRYGYPLKKQLVLIGENRYGYPLKNLY